MAKNFGETERRICSLFSAGAEFMFNNVLYYVLFSGKPTCSKGEPKTDIYVKAKEKNGIRDIELKISFKQRNADFLENKTNPERAEQLFGTEWSNIIRIATKTIEEAFYSKPLIYKSSFGRTDAGAITLGWKFELLNVHSGQLSGDMILSNSQIVNVYAGSNLSADKRNASVNGIVIANSGIADYILFEDEIFENLQDTVNALQTIPNYVATHPNIYFACKALNYRTFKQKFDGNRPLAVFVEWNAINGKLTPTLHFDTPLEVGGNYVAEKLLVAMKMLNIKTTDDINPSNVADMSFVFNNVETTREFI